jgi:predicted O-methyltransferase YrrM
MDNADLIYTHLIQKEAFCFIKLNDGEISALDPNSEGMSRGDEKSSELMSIKLKESLNYRNDNYYIGLPCINCNNNYYNIAINNISNDYDENLKFKNIVGANILINSNVNKTLDILKNHLSDRNIVIITNTENLNNIDKLKKVNIVPYKTIEVSERFAFDSDYNKIKDLWTTLNNDDVVICLCGPLGRVICYEWFKNNNTLTCLELGSFFDPLLKNRTYLYHTGNHQYCNVCYPVLEIVESDMLKLCEGKMRKECYYFYEENGFFSFYGYIWPKILKNAEIRLENECDSMFLKLIKSKCYGKMLDEYLNEYVNEGHFLQIDEQDKALINVLDNLNEYSNLNDINILEIGFYAGHSASLILSSTNSSISVTSIELTNSSLSNKGKTFIDKHFSNRHNLIYGDSANILRQLINNDKKYDVILIDGNNDSDIRFNDLILSSLLLKENGIIMMDDTIKDNNLMESWNHGASFIWNKFTNKNSDSYIIQEIYSCDYFKGRGFSYGKVIVSTDTINQSLLNDKLLMFKRKNKTQMINKIEEMYKNNENKLLEYFCDIYIDCFSIIKDEHLKKIKLFKCLCILINNHEYTEELIKLIETLYNKNHYISQDVSQIIETLMKNKLYKYDLNPIPKIIHLLYFGETNFENYHYECIKSIIKNMPNYKVILYNKVEPINNKYWDDIKKYIEIEKIDVPEEYNGYSLHYFQYKADVVRLNVLYEKGGIYLDIDLLIIKNFENVINTGYDLYLSEEGEKDGGLINAFIACKPKNEFIKLWLESFKTGLRMENWAYHIRDGNKNLLNNNKHYNIKYNINILESKYFFPFAWPERHKFENIREYLNDDIYGIHLFETILHNVLTNNSYWNSNCIQIHDYVENNKINNSSEKYGVLYYYLLCAYAHKINLPIIFNKNKLKYSNNIFFDIILSFINNHNNNFNNNNVNLYNNTHNSNTLNDDIINNFNLNIIQNNISIETIISEIKNNNENTREESDILSYLNTHIINSEMRETVNKYFEDNKEERDITINKNNIYIYKIDDTININYELNKLYKKYNNDISLINNSYDLNDLNFNIKPDISLYTLYNSNVLLSLSNNYFILLFHLLNKYDYLCVSKKWDIIIELDLLKNKDLNFFKVKHPFDELVILTLEEYPENQIHVKEQLKNHNLNGKFMINKLNKRPMIGCLQAHMNAIRYAKSKKLKSIMICEDDIIINDVFDRIDDYPSEWDMLYFGGILTNFNKIENGWVKGTTWCNHAYIVKDTLYDVILYLYDSFDLEEMYALGRSNDWLYTTYIHNDYNCWVHESQPIIQKNRLSLIDHSLKWPETYVWSTWYSNTINKNKLEIIGITVSTNYSDILQYCIKNKIFMKKWYIITDENDKNTIDLINNNNELNNIELLFYNFKQNNSIFDKGGAIKLAQEKIYENYNNEYILILDSDVILRLDIADKISNLNIDEDTILNVSDRINFLTYNDYLNNKFVSKLSDKYDDNLNWKIAGYFQLYKNNKYYYENSYNCSDCDLVFHHNFGKNDTIDSSVSHIGIDSDWPTGKNNWNGRIV